MADFDNSYDHQDDYSDHLDIYSDYCGNIAYHHKCFLDHHTDPRNNHTVYPNNIYLVSLSFIFHKNPCTNARARVVNSVYSSCERIYARIFIKFET